MMHEGQRQSQASGGTTSFSASACFNFQHDHKAGQFPGNWRKNLINLKQTSKNLGNHLGFDDYSVLNDFNEGKVLPTHNYLCIDWTDQEK